MCQGEGYWANPNANPAASVGVLPYSSFQHYGPEIKWVEGGKPLLKVSTHLVSTVYTQVWVGGLIPLVVLPASSCKTASWCPVNVFSRYRPLLEKST